MYHELVFLQLMEDVRSSFRKNLVMIRRKPEEFHRDCYEDDKHDQVRWDSTDPSLSKKKSRNETADFSSKQNTCDKS